MLYILIVLEQHEIHLIAKLFSANLQRVFLSFFNFILSRWSDKIEPQTQIFVLKYWHKLLFISIGCSIYAVAYLYKKLVSYKISKG